jgi:hypothetical protein
MSEERRRLNAMFWDGWLGGLGVMGVIDASFADPFRWTTVAIWTLIVVLSWTRAVRE